MNINDLNFFLSFGYFPCQSKSVENYFDEKVYLSSLDESYESLVVNAKNNFLEQLSCNLTNKKNIVPLSGGMDSRAILAGLLQVTSASSIETFTYGTKGCMDYEIGPAVAKGLGVINSAYDLGSYELNYEELIARSIAVGKQTEIMHCPPVLLLGNAYKENTVWSGVMGDIVAGSVGSILNPKNIGAKKYLEGKMIDANGFFSGKNLEFYSKKLIKNNKLFKLVGDKEGYLFTDRLNGYYMPIIGCGAGNIITPFLNDKILSMFFAGRIKEPKQGQFYRDFLRLLDKKAFSYPLKNNFGYGLDAGYLNVMTGRLLRKIKVTFGSGVDPSINYFDFSMKMNNDASFNFLIKDLLVSFKKRNIDIDLNWPDIFENISSNKNSTLIKRIISIEIHFQNGLAV